MTICKAQCGRTKHALQGASVTKRLRNQSEPVPADKETPPRNLKIIKINGADN